MKKFLSFVIVLMFSFAISHAQDWSFILNNISGLPGVTTTTTGGEYYHFTSQVFNPGTTTQKVRLTVLDTETHEQPNGNNYCFALSELAIYDGNGNKINYVATSNADHNNLSWNTDGGGIFALSDNDYNTYFHSMWASYGAVSDYHYLELSLSQPVSSFSLEWGTRVGESKNAPIKVAITLGTDYAESTIGKEFTLGNSVTTSAALSVEGQLFVMQSNNITSFTTATGDLYYGSGPVYMLCAEKGTSTASFSNVLQLIPVTANSYIVYWPNAGCFLKDSGSDYNGKNGWQYSTTDIDKAAIISFKELPMGYFEMYYTSTYNITNDDGAVSVTDTLYIGADIRDNTSSKTKTFAPNKKAALDAGDYNQGYALPIAFNWSFYKATLNASTVESISISMSQIASMRLSTDVMTAKNYLAEYGDFDGACTGNEVANLNSAIATAESYMETEATPTLSQINAAKETLSAAILNYLAFNLDVYKANIEQILDTVTFSTYPYVNGTYPENSRVLLEESLEYIAQAKNAIDSYEVSQLLSVFSRIDSDIERFHATKIKYSTFPLVYDESNGLPGTLDTYGGYIWQSPQIVLNRSVSGVRITFNESNISQFFNDYPIISLAEILVFDGEQSELSLTEANFATNSQELSEGPLSAICDGNDDSYWHSIWKEGIMNPEGEVYIEITFPSPMSTFTLGFKGRNTGELSPTKMTLTAIGDNNVTEVEGETVYVYLTDGGVEAYPVSIIEDGYYTEGDFTCFPLTCGDVIYYTSQEVDSISSVAPSLPEFTSYKFNNKFNPNLNVDVVADVIEEEMLFPINSIGKYLTASFQLSDDRAVVYIDTVLQESKVTRQSFEQPKTYTVTYPGYKKVLGSQKIKDAVWEYEDGTSEEIPLTADMLSTNKPSTSANEGVGSLLDGNSSTIFHSTWGSANNATIDVDAYITIDLPKQVENIKLYYQCRPQTGYNPLELEIYKSDNGNNWTLARTLTTADGLPTGGSGQVYTSPIISLGSSTSYLKILQTSGEYSKNHMALAEMRIYDVTPGDSILVSEEEYALTSKPFGRNYKVNVNWLIDNAPSVPRIDIDIENGAEVVNKDVYLDAYFRISGFGIYDNFEDSVQIKGRGNTSWTSTGKKPYRLKFASKVKPFGLTKGKSWVLLANRQNHSMMANAVAMKIGQMAGAEYTNHIIPVDLYVNGTYRGNYMFTEKVGISNNSVDIDDKLGYLLELDTYYDETYKFTSKNFKLPVNIKDPDLSDYTSTDAEARKALIEEDFNKLDIAAYNFGEIEDILDVEAFARFMLANELVLNQEIGHPKSTFLFKEELENPESKIKFGPIWDFDWGFGYESTQDYGLIDYKTSVFNSSMMSEPGYRFFSYLMSFDIVQKYYYKVWTEFLNNNSIDELLDYMDSYYTFAKSSFESNANVWGDGRDYATINSRMKQWVSTRADYLYSTLTEYDLDEFNYPLACDVDKNNYLSIHDVAVTTAYLKGNTHSSFNYSKADTDTDGFITSTDVQTIETAIASADFLEPMQYYNIPVGIGEIKMENFVLPVNESYILPIEITRYDSENYKALQMDIIVPDGIMIMEAAAADAITDHKVILSQRDLTTYRMMLYSNGDELINDSKDAIVNLNLFCYMDVADSLRNVKLSNILAVDELTDEYRLSDVMASFDHNTILVGDINGDGEINVGDFAALVNLIFNSENIDDATMAVADINGDGEVNVGDFAGLVNLIFNSGSQAAPKRAAAVTPNSADYSLYIEPFTLAAGEEKEVKVFMNNPSKAISQLQFDIELPEGVEIVKAEKENRDLINLGSRTNEEKHSVSTIANGNCRRVVCLSGENELFEGNSSDVLVMTVKGDETLTNGSYEFGLSNIVLSGTDAVGIKVAPNKGSIFVGTTGVDAIIADGDKNADVYDLGGRKVKDTDTKNVYIKENKKVIGLE